MRKLIFILITICIYSCNKSQVIESNVTNSVTTIKNKLAHPLNSMQTKPITYELIKDISPIEVIKRYKPLFTDDFLLCNGQTEFRINLYNTLPREQWNSTVQMKEITWEINDKENLTVWYQEKNNIWLLVYHFVWDKGSEF